MKENNIEELKQMLEELYQTQQARLDVGADDLDIREEIAEVEEEIKELQDDTNVNRENSIKNEQSSIENIKILEGIIKGDEDCINAIYSQMKVKNDNDEDIQYYKKEIQSIKNIVNNYLKEKARADKLEKEYSKMLTKIDEYEVNYIPVSLVEETIEELIKEGRHYNANKIEVLQELLESEE